MERWSQSVVATVAGLAKDIAEKIEKAATPKQGRYIRLVAQAEINGNPWASAAESSAILAP